MGNSESIMTSSLIVVTYIVVYKAYDEQNMWCANVLISVYWKTEFVTDRYDTVSETTGCQTYA
jgi:hypothetical protein